MKVLNKLLLVHWHYFKHETIEFGELNFLTGKNASGKSTIVDALQLILLGDTSGSFFNKAASGRGNRTLKGYLMGELGDDEGAGFRYLRTGRFTSYIVLEFYDKEKKRYFTAGCCFDIYSENDITKLFFLYDGEMHSQGFLKDSIPMDITALRAFLRERYNGRYETTDVGRDFKTKLYGKLGGLRDRFAGLLKKAVSFNPNVDIQDFISDFVCDNQQTVDVSHMQENIRSYKRLEYEASILQERIALLGQIVSVYENYTDTKNREMLYSFLLDRATVDIKNTELHSAESSANELKEQLDELTSKITDVDKQLTELRKQRDTLQAEYLSEGAVQALEKINQQIIAKEEKLQTLQNDYEKAKSSLVIRIASWRDQIEAMLQKIDILKPDLLQAGILSRISDINEEGRNLFEQITVLVNIDANVITRIGEEGLIRISNLVDRLKTHAIELNSKLCDEQDILSKQRAELVVEQHSLEKGIYPFPKDAIELKEALNSRLRTIAKKDVNARIIAEVTEIKNDRWRNVIEGYLHTQKFYIIVPQEYFRDALHVFDAIKRTKAVYGTGIVDIEKLRKLSPIADAESLAEEIETDDIDVRLFLDFMLGRVQKCDSVRELRRHRTSITDEGMLYQNFVVRAMSPERWSKPAIGQSAIRLRLEVVENEINVLENQLAICASVITGLDAVGSLVVLNDTEIERIVLNAKNMAIAPDLEADLISLRKNREAIDTTSSDLLKIRITALDRGIDEKNIMLRTEVESKAKLNERQRCLQNETIPKLTVELHEQEAVITSCYNDEWISETGILRYNRELSSRGTADLIASAFPRELSRVKNAKEIAWESLIELRRSYNDKYKMGFDIKAASNEVYDNTWLELSDNKLPEYQTRINDAELKAFEQFQEDFISRLQNNIKNAKYQIEDLNGALKGAAFGEDTYRFRIIPKPEYKRYHDMIVDDMITQGGYNLFSFQFNEKYKEEVADLFAIITNEEGGGGGSSEYERRVLEFTDFRTYLSFDLEVVGHDGESQRLSKTMGKKSGGETQTPFYIAVLASFAQLYRAGRDKVHKTSRLIIFDEAFSKMDGERIVRSIELLRKFEFQVILSAPPDKIGEIATLVDRNLCVLREGKDACVRGFDPKQTEEFNDE
jgi:energy-coupling factor transporter ATP-binding protein EcfA2